MQRSRIVLAGIALALLSCRSFAQTAEDLPDVKTALARFKASEQKARDRLVKDLQKAQDKAIKGNKLEQAVSIRELKDRIAAGDPVPFEDPRLRDSLNGTTWSWHNNWQTDGMKIQFTRTEILIEPSAASEQRHTYIATGSQTLKYADKKLIFNQDFTKFVAITENFDYRTGVRTKAAPPKAVQIAPPVSMTFAGHRAGEERTDNHLKMPFCWCPAGRFNMGAPSKQVSVTLTHGFWIGKYEVTQGEWQKIMSTTPWQVDKYMKIGPQYPATNMTLNDAMEFCRKLTQSEQDAVRLPLTWAYTIPTEAQWEYACRAGTTTPHSFGDDPSELDAYAWWGGQHGQGNARNEQYAHAVGTKAANPWGIHDLHGNVWEFVRDLYQADLPGGTDPYVNVKGARAVYRGGSWCDDAASCNSSHRGEVPWQHPKANNRGFRVALVPAN